MRNHPYRQALWLAWFGLTLCGGFLLWDVLIGNVLGVAAMAVMVGLLSWLLRDIRRRRLADAAARRRHG